MIDTTKYQVSHNGPLKQEWIDFIHKQRLDNHWSYKTLGEHLGISGAFAHNLLNKNGNVTTATAMQHVANGIERLKAGESEPLQRDPGLGKLGMLSHSYHLRADLSVKIDLPVDITEKETDRLALFVRSLAQ